VTKALPYTKHEIARAIAGIEKAGRFVVGFRVSDGTLIVADKPFEMTSLAAEIAQPSPDRTDWGARLGGKRETARS
jgi:hypothetical protein